MSSIFPAKADREDFDDRFGNFILDSKNVIEGTIITLRSWTSIVPVRNTNGGTKGSHSD
jgi:hypothetical protein